MALRKGVLWALVCFGAVTIAVGCGKAQDSIVGRWTDTRVGEMIVEFHADGTAKFDNDFEKQRQRLYRMNPGREAAVDAAIAQRKNDSQQASMLGLTWSKENDAYSISTPASQGFMKFRLRDGTLYFIRNDGTDGLPYAKAQ